MRTQGLLTPKQIAKRLDVSYHTVKIWRRAGLLVGHCINDKGQCLFEDPGADAPIKYRHQGKLRGKTAAARSNDTRTHS
ncbi:MAG: helix-turn-helix domain-containing protein [Steroidobacteraceae bacterium]